MQQGGKAITEVSCPIILLLQQSKAEKNQMKNHLHNAKIKISHNSLQIRGGADIAFIK